MKIKLLVAAAATVVASSAMAASAFEGAYGQLGVGYENNTVSSRVFNVTGASTFSGSAPSSSGGGFSGTVGLGYNFSVAPQWLVGIGADYAPTNVTTSTQPVLSCSDCDGTNNYKVKNRYNIYVTPGYEIDKDKLIYVKGGYSNQAITWQPQANVSGVSSLTSNVSGYVAGLGYKQLIDKNIYVFGEGNYYSYSNYNTGTLSQSSGKTYAQTQTPSAYQFLVGVGYKF